MTETSSQVSWSSPKDSFYEKVLCCLSGMIITEAIWQNWAAHDGKKAPQPSLVSAQIQLNVISKRATQLVHFLSHPAPLLMWGQAQNHTDGDPGPSSGPETPPSVRWRGDGGLLEAEARGRWARSPTHMAWPLAYPSTVGDSDSMVALQTPNFSAAPCDSLSQTQGWAREGSENLGTKVRWVILKGRPKNDSKRYTVLLFTHPDAIPKYVLGDNVCGEGEVTHPGLPYLNNNYDILLCISLAPLFYWGWHQPHPPSLG